MMTSPDFFNPTHAGMRLDQALAARYPQYSRAALKRHLESGHLAINGKPHLSPKTTMTGEESILWLAPLEKSQPLLEALPQYFPLNIIYENEQVLVVSKPANMVTHPAIGHPSHTLVNYLLGYRPALQSLPRAGIIHRLDKDTSGLLVAAKTLESHQFYTQALKRRNISREYLALVQGSPSPAQTLHTHIGRDRAHPKRMKVLSHAGREAITHLRTVTPLGVVSLVQLALETGRTHQVRVHLSHIGHPIIGDQEYQKGKLPKSSGNALLDQQLRQFPRQALHAYKLILPEFENPGRLIPLQAPLPYDLAALLAQIRHELLHQ